MKTSQRQHHHTWITTLPVLQLQHSMTSLFCTLSGSRRKNVVIVRPYCSPDPNSPKYEQFCRQKLMLYQPFRRQEELLAGNDTYAAAYVIFLQSGNVPPSLEEGIYRLEQQSQQTTEDNTEVLPVIMFILLRYLKHEVILLSFRNRMMTNTASLLLVL